MEFQESTRINKKDIIASIDAQVVSSGKRFANMLIDFLFYYLLAFITGIILAIFQLGFLIEKIPNILFGTILILLYFIFFEGIFGKSIGKYITKTKVVTELGEKPSFLTILVRSLCRLIPFDAFSFLSQNPIGWHDSISKTRVISNIKQA